MHVPKGDFTKQKYIIGRKVDEDKETSTSFNFKLPFDDFIPLENLTYNSVFASKGYLANKPADGLISELDKNYLEKLEAYNTAITGDNAALESAKSHYQTLRDHILEQLQSYQSNPPKASIITSNYYSSTKTYYQRLEDIITEVFRNELDLTQLTQD